MTLSVRPSVGWLVGRLVSLSVCRHFLAGREVLLVSFGELQLRTVISYRNTKLLRREAIYYYLLCPFVRISFCPFVGCSAIALWFGAPVNEKQNIQ